jgi:hypothetical protein
MVAMYCRHHHGKGPLCAECAKLADYAKRRLHGCVFGDAKPTCAKCVVHCYSPDLREQVRVVMSWAGPRMILKHPILAIAHLLDERRPIPLMKSGRRS